MEKWKHREDARKWLENFANEVGLTYEEVVQAGFAGEQGLDTGANMDPENAFYEDYSISDYWNCWEVVTGEVEKDQSTRSDRLPFKCHC
jgi:hypothetical protein